MSRFKVGDRVRCSVCGREFTYGEEDVSCYNFGSLSLVEPALVLNPDEWEERDRATDGSRLPARMVIRRSCEGRWAQNFHYGNVAWGYLMGLLPGLAVTWGGNATRLVPLPMERVWLLRFSDERGDSVNGSAVTTGETLAEVRQRQADGYWPDGRPGAWSPSNPDLWVWADEHYPVPAEASE